MLIKLTITQLLMGLFEKFFRLHDPTPPLFHTSQRARIECGVSINIHNAHTADL